MRQPGLDGRNRDANGEIRLKRSDTQNQNLPNPIPGFGPTTTLKIMREKTGQTSDRGLRKAVTGK
jgi:hypothetical protein